MNGGANSQELPRILVVDDRPENLLAMEKILAELDVQIIQASSGEQALAAMLRHQFAVVLMDVQMPGMDGLETASLMQGHDKTMQTPVIFVTGNGMDELNELEAYATGAADYIIKPVNPHILKSKVSMFLQLYRQSEQLKNKYTQTTASLEQILKEKNSELEKNNASLEQINFERQQQYDQTRRLLNMNPDGMLVIDHNNIILYTNPAAAILLNREKEQLQGEGFSYPLPYSKNAEIVIGNDNIVEMSGVPIDWSGKRANLVTLHDITALKHTEAKLLQLSQYDPLTGLANRRHCLDSMVKVLARARRRNGYIAVLFLDLDKFKDVNDSLGHDRGDALLQSVARRLNTCIRESDLATRFGGDEFALILDEISQPEDAGLIAQKIIDALVAPHQLQGKSITVGCSIGIATFPLCGEDPETLLKAADIAMFNAKSKGRNNYQFFAETMQQQLLQRTHLEQDLRQALQRNEFVLHYQPQIDAGSGAIVALEALLRWQHADKGMIPPGEFIPVAEKAGLIVDIGDWVMREACSQAQVWQTAFRANGHDHASPLTMAVNVSVRQLSNGDFRQRVEHVLHDTGIDPHCLELELTESLMMDDPEASVAELEAIRKQGLGIAIDDFGTGYSSLSYLQRLSLNTLKIDLSFVSEIGKNPHSEILIKTIISMAHSLAMRVVAEGVETEQQVAFLRHNKCDLLQGYYFSRPLPRDQTTQLLQDCVAQRYQWAC